MGRRDTSEGRNWGKSAGRNWDYTGFLGGRRWISGNAGTSEGRSWSRGRSKGWNEGRSEGVSHGTSRSRTDGTSESWTEGVSETEGVTHGTSQSRTSGSSETIQKRALITPDEIGQVFACASTTRNAKSHIRELALAGDRRGEAVVPCNAANCFEDYQFMELFDHIPIMPSRRCLACRSRGVIWGLRVVGVRAEDRRLVGEGRTDRGRRRRGRRGAGDERHGRPAYQACRARC